MKEPKYVGIPGYMMHGKETNLFGAASSHLNFIQKCGAIPRIIFPEEPTIEDLHMLYLPGGPDLLTSSYNEAPGMFAGSPDPYRQYFFDRHLMNYIEAGIPILGICLGAQMINVALGGSLYQHLSNHEYSETRDEKVHEVFSLQDNELFEVNSMHHQGVKKLGEGLIPDCVYGFKSFKGNKKPNARPISKWDLVESFIHRTLPIQGIQWHPEEIFDSYSVNAFKQLLIQGDKRIKGLRQTATTVTTQPDEQSTGNVSVQEEQNVPKEEPAF